MPEISKKDTRFPNVGMKHEDVRKRIKRIVKSDTANKAQKQNLINSLANQAERHAGVGSKIEILKEAHTMSKQYRMGAGSPIDARQGRGSGNGSGGWGTGYKLHCPTCIVPPSATYDGGMWICSRCGSPCTSTKRF